MQAAPPPASSRRPRAPHVTRHPPTPWQCRTPNQIRVSTRRHLRCSKTATRLTRRCEPTASSTDTRRPRAAAAASRKRSLMEAATWGSRKVQRGARNRNFFLLSSFSVHADDTLVSPTHSFPPPYYKHLRIMSSAGMTKKYAAATAAPDGVRLHAAAQNNLMSLGVCNVSQHANVMGTAQKNAPIT